MPLLLLSKRLHSIYMLRLFNDPFSIFFLFAAVLLWQKKMWTLGSMAYSMAVGVKMNTLLALPAVGAILLQAVGRNKALRQAMVMAQVQVSRYLLSRASSTLIVSSCSQLRSLWSIPEVMQPAHSSSRDSSSTSGR